MAPRVERPRVDIVLAVDVIIILFPNAASNIVAKLRVRDECRPGLREQGTMEKEKRRGGQRSCGQQLHRDGRREKEERHTSD